MPGGLEIVDEPGDQRRLGPDDDEPDLHQAAEVHDGPVISYVERDVAAKPGRARISRRDEQALQASAPGDRKRQRMLAPAGADEKNVHEPPG